VYIVHGGVFFVRLYLQYKYLDAQRESELE
jgi:hypothetical protein